MKISTLKKFVGLVFLLSSLVLLKKVLFSNDTHIKANSRKQQTERNSAQQEIVLDWKHKTGPRTTFEVVDPDVVTVIIEPNNVYFRRAVFDTRLSILILVSTFPEATVRRNAIRNTWASWISDTEISNKFSIKILFFIGLARSGSPLQLLEMLEKENSQFQDIIVDDFADYSFYDSSLTPKTIRMFKWYMQTFHNNSRGSIHAPDFFVKSDHDVFINIPKLGSFVSSLLANTSRSISSEQSSSSSMSSSSSYEYDYDFTQKILDSNSSSEEDLELSLPSWYFIGGKVFNNPLHERRKYADFLISPEFWFGKSFSQYPPYVGGPVFILSGNIVPLLYEGAFSVPLFPFEDIYLFGLVGRQYLNATITDVPGIQIELKNPLNIIHNNSELRKIIAVHPIESEEQMKTVFTSVLNSNNKKRWLL